MREDNTSLGGVQSRFPETSGRLLSRLHDRDGEGFTINEYLSRQCLKRGGGARNFPLNDDVDFEDLLADPLATDPEKVFDQLWIVGVADGEVQRVREHGRAEGRAQ
jgi:hypothetical protein